MDGRSERNRIIAGAEIVAPIVADRRAIMVALAYSSEVTIDAVAAMTGLAIDRITTAVADFRTFEITRDRRRRGMTYRCTEGHALAPLPDLAVDTSSHETAELYVCAACTRANGGEEAAPRAR